jgi:membrane protein
MERVRQKLAKYPALLKVYNRLNALHLPGASHVTVWDTGFFLFRELGNSRFNVRAAAMAFNFFFALFPALVFMISLIPVVPVHHLKDELLKYLQQYLPEQSYQIVLDTVQGSAAASANSILSISLFLVLFSSTRGILVMMYAFERDLPGFAKRSFLISQLASVGMVVLLSVFFIVALSVSILAELWVDFLPLHILPFPDLTVFAIRLLDICITYAILLFTFGMIYYWVPCRTKKWKFLSPGAFVGAAFAMIATLAFSIFVANFANYNKIYGSISAIMVLMVWMYWISMVVLLGFELNLAIDKAGISGKKILDANED